MKDKIFYTYILLTERNTLYCGYTDDIENRFKKHCLGIGAKYTRANKPKKIVFLTSFNDKSQAIKEERRIKKLTRQQKDELIYNFVLTKNTLFDFAQTINLKIKNIT